VALRIPPLDNNVLPLAIGVQLDQARLEPERAHRVTVVHHAVVPGFGRGKEARCYQPESVIVGGFTLEFRIRRSQP
jgi:hypothetical protein